VVRALANLSLAPAAAVALFLVISRLTTGAWFVTDGFYIRDPGYDGLAGRSLIAVWWGTHQLSTTTTELVALVGAALVCLRAVTSRSRSPMLVPISLFAAAALPFYAFFEGHPFRIRYMTPMVAVCATFVGLFVGMLRRDRMSRLAAAVVVALMIGVTLLQSPPWRRDAPMLVEAQWDAPASEGRRVVTECLRRDYRGDKILASMGSLAHYMQELSSAGMAIRDFVHEGNGVIWKLALETGPAPHAGWMLVEEEAEGGDLLADRVRHEPAFARGMTRVCEGGGVALYKRNP
jgi:hypothetical protein